MQLILTDNHFDPKPHWENPIVKYDFPFYNCVDLFDTNGYDLTELEQDYAEVNTPATLHRNVKALKYEWFRCPEAVTEGVHINHALLFERKAYAGKALEQLKVWSDRLPLVHKLTKIQSKWGIDLSIDYVDRNGNAFEIFHYEWDDFNYDKVMLMKEKIEHLALNTDWDAAAMDLLEKRGDWMHLPFFEQSDWKCDYFGIEPEKFKENIWNDMP